MHEADGTTAPRPAPQVMDYEGSDYQQRFWEQGDREYEDLAERIALQKLLPIRPADGGVRRSLWTVGRPLRRLRAGHLARLLALALRQAQARLGLGGRFVYVAANLDKLP